MALDKFHREKAERVLKGEERWHEKIYLKELITKDEQLKDTGFFYAIHADLQNLVKDRNRNIYMENERTATLLVILGLLFGLPGDMIVNKILNEKGPVYAMALVIKFLDFSKFVTFDSRGDRSNHLLILQMYLSGPALFNELYKQNRDNEDLFLGLVEILHDARTLSLRRSQAR